MQSGYVWLHINTLSRVTLSCQVLYYKNKGFTCSYWHIRHSQLFLKEIISITSCSSSPQGFNLYSSVPSLLFIPYQLNIKKKSMEINKQTHNIVSKWKSEPLHSTGITQDLLEPQLLVMLRQTSYGPIFVLSYMGFCSFCFTLPSSLKKKIYLIKSSRVHKVRRICFKCYSGLTENYTKK